MFKNINELVNSPLSFEEKMYNLPILIVTNDNKDSLNLETYFKRNGFQNILSASKTEEIMSCLDSKEIKELLRICIINLDLGEKYFKKDDFKDLANFDAELFWKNCIKDKVLSIIGDIGVPISFEKFIDLIKNFGTVDLNLPGEMEKIISKAKALDTNLLLKLLKEQNLLLEIETHFITEDTDQPHFVRVTEEVKKQNFSTFHKPIMVKKIFEIIKDSTRKIIEKYQKPVSAFKEKDIDEEPNIKEYKKLRPLLKESKWLKKK